MIIWFIQGAKFMNEMTDKKPVQNGEAEVLVLVSNEKIRTALTDMIRAMEKFTASSSAQLSDVPNIAAFKTIVCDGQEQNDGELIARLKSGKTQPRVIYFQPQPNQDDLGWLYMAQPITRQTLFKTIEQAMNSSQSTPLNRSAPREFLIGGGRFDPNKRMVIDLVTAAEIRLTEKESAILELLLSHDQPLLSRDILYNRIWGRAANVTEHTVDSHLYRLRRKLAEFGCELISADSGYYLKPVHKGEGSL